MATGVDADITEHAVSTADAQASTVDTAVEKDSADRLGVTLKVGSAAVPYAAEATSMEEAAFTAGMPSMVVAGMEAGAVKDNSLGRIDRAGRNDLPALFLNEAYQEQGNWIQASRANKALCRGSGGSENHRARLIESHHL